MQVEALDALDPVIRPPAAGGAIQAVRKQTVQNSEENRALQSEIMPAGTGSRRRRGSPTPPTAVRMPGLAQSVAPPSARGESVEDQSSGPNDV
jgi:hypothetical protein